MARKRPFVTTLWNILQKIKKLASVHQVRQHMTQILNKHSFKIRIIYAITNTTCPGTLCVCINNLYVCLYSYFIGALCMCACKRSRVAKRSRVNILIRLLYNRLHDFLRCSLLITLCNGGCTYRMYVTNFCYTLYLIPKVYI